VRVLTDADKCAAILQGKQILHPTDPDLGNCGLCGIAKPEGALYLDDCPETWFYFHPPFRVRDLPNLVRYKQYAWCTELTP
jgi:hypothetical protein